ncbi:MAG TPA: hypothetical protein VGV07_02715 [Devosia sp.]|uniref:hypothetical protein n=1 Tax=Devosia sp. TaxID=1871048 RepID=UPI002DDD2A71|nr:hypothetical protein [Devosia sp.]HEV2514137.1 hypothetical protein [Devosia sp.]
MPQLQPTGPFPIDGARMPTWIIRFDERGQCTSPATARALLDHLRAAPYSDILLFSHGWNTDFSGAVALYRDFLAAFETVRAAHPVAGFNPIFVGITWPSAWFAEDPGPKLESVAVAAADVEGKVLAEVAAPLGDPDRQRLYELANAGVLSREQALDLVTLLLPAIGGTEDEVDTATEVDAEALLAASKRLGALGGGSAPNFDPATGLPDAEVMGGDGGFDPRDIIRMLSLYQMKDRSGAVGARGVSILLRQLLGASAAKVRLLGHSFGCKVMLSAVCVGAPLSRPVTSMLLMQPALSHLAMALSVPGRNGPGGYRSALSEVSGQIFTTYSAKDMPLHDVFHLALRRRQDLGEAEIAAAGEPPSRYAAMGGYGPRGAGERLLSPIPAAGHAYPDLKGIKLVALDGSADRINGHGDIATGYTAWALHRLISDGNMTQDLNTIRAEISALELPAETELEAGVAAELPAVPDYKPGVPQVITVGSQIAEFSENVPADLRSTIANCILLAQLAADRWVATHPDADELNWYNCYVAVLKKCGWLIERNETSLKSVSGDGFKVHQEIISVLTAALGGAAAASIILGVLSGLKKMDENQPFFTIFDRASQRAEATLFQISYVDGGAGKQPRLNFAAYRVEASATATQILFFRLTGTNAKLRSSYADLSIDESILRAVRDQIFAKVGDRITGSITSIEI